MGDDYVINIKFTNESLRKQKYTMHLVFTGGRSGDVHGSCDLVCKGTRKQIGQDEKDLWGNDVHDFYQKKVWVYSADMQDLATQFVKYKNEVYRENIGVMLILDSLSAYLDIEVKDIFGSATIKLCYSPPNMPNFIQRSNACIVEVVKDLIRRARESSNSD